MSEDSTEGSEKINKVEDLLSKAGEKSGEDEELLAIGASSNIEPKVLEVGVEVKEEGTQEAVIELQTDSQVSLPKQLALSMANGLMNAKEISKVLDTLQVRVMTSLEGRSFEDQPTTTELLNIYDSLGDEVSHNFPGKVPSGCRNLDSILRINERYAS